MEDFLEKLTLTNHQLMSAIEGVVERTTLMEFQVNSKSAKMSMQESHIQELFNRIATAETSV